MSRGQSIDRDLVVLTDNERYLSTMIDRGWAEKLDKDAIPNIENLVDVQRHPGFGSDREFSLPWQSGMTGIAYNAKLTKPITSVDQLLEDPDLKGKVTMLDNFSDTLGIVMLASGDDPVESRTTLSRAPSTECRGVRLGPDPPIHRQRLHRPARERRPQGLPRLVGRRRQLSPIRTSVGIRTRAG